MNKPTSGNWDCKPVLDTNVGSFEVVAGKTTLAFVLGKDSAHNAGCKIPWEEGRANARIMAAAKDLLAACKAARDDLDQLLASPVIDQLELAIAKAEVP